MHRSLLKPQLQRFRLCSPWAMTRSKLVSSPALADRAATRPVSAISLWHWGQSDWDYCVSWFLELPRVALLANPNLTAAATAIGQQIDVFHASSNREIDAAFAALVQRQDAAVLVIPDALFFDRRVQLITLAARHAIPAIYASREYAEAGGLMSYGTDLADVLRQVGAYAGRILKGAKPADLPVVQPTKFELVVNMQTAKLIGLEISPTLLARADEVIE